MTKLALGSALAIALALVAVSSVGAQGPDVQISKLECIDDTNVAGIQELVVIENLGDVTQDFTGWELQSDPPGSEVYDLSQLGSLPKGASVRIESGPSASGVFKWGLESIFRDDDPTDYARIVDDTGAIVHQVNCAGGATPTPSPTPSPKPSLAGEIPNGGGLPPVAEGAVWPTITLLIGGSIAVAGVALIALPRLRLRSSLMTVASPPQREPSGANGTRQEPFSASIGLVLLALAAAVVFQLLRRPGS